MSPGPGIAFDGFSDLVVDEAHGHVYQDSRGRVRIAIPGRRDYAGLLWRVRAMSPDYNLIAMRGVGEYHRFRFVR